MKFYAIKATKIESNTSWYATRISDSSIEWVLKLDHAWRFNTVEGAVNALVRRAVRTHNSYWAEDFRYTVVGIERNEPQPVYKEVEL